jgi:hypothetical protein
VKALDGTGANIRADQDTSLTLVTTGSSYGNLYSDSSCTQELFPNQTSVTLSQGDSELNVYFSDLSPETPTIVTKYNNVTNTAANQFWSATLSPPTVTDLQISTYGSTSTCMKVSVYVTGSGTGIIESMSSYVVTFSNIDSSGGGHLYSDSSCTQQVTSITVPANTAGNAANSLFFGNPSTFPVHMSFSASMPLSTGGTYSQSGYYLSN